MQIFIFQVYTEQEMTSAIILLGNISFKATKICKEISYVIIVVEHLVI